MANLNERMVALGTQRSIIRELFEFGKLRAAEIGAENVFDFSIGNPSVPSPDAVNGINLVLYDADDKRYFKQHEIVLYRVPRYPVVLNDK